MSICIVTGSAGLVGSASARRFAAEGYDVIGIDNDTRARLFGPDASTIRVRVALQKEIIGYRHMDMDIRDADAMEALFKEHGAEIGVIVHTAAQPSHDWSASDPLCDFSINAGATVSLLELTRRYCPDAVFIFVSTNKVYGDRSNTLAYEEQETRWSLSASDPYAAFGFDEAFPIDHSVHSPFGASKVAADVMTQEFGKYFGMNTVCFRGGCLTGPNHLGAELHGFLAYLAKCVVFDMPYTVNGYNGKQVRDNIHVDDLVEAFWQVVQRPVQGEVFNMGGGVFANCSMLEAIGYCQERSGRKLDYTVSDRARKGDHIWWISDTRKFQSAYPAWEQRYDIEETIYDIVDRLAFLRDNPA